MEVANRTTRKSGLSGRMHHDPATINRILLGFRPIAPKPAANGSEADNARVTEAVKDLKRRPKRKYVRVNKISGDASGSGRKFKSKSKNTAGKVVVEVDDNPRDLRFDVDGAGFVGFQGQDLRVTSSPEESGSGANGMMRFGLGTSNDNNPGLELGLGLGLGSVDRAVETWVVVSGVTAAEGGGLVGMMIPDGDRMRSLDLDTCPGMISDGLHRVQWVNPAYKAMVVDPSAAAEVAVRLVLKEDIPAGLSAFACTVRVVYTWRKEKYSKTMPCDVWKMECGGFAWRLDTKAALCLGR